MTAAVCDQDRVTAVARALLDLDGRKHEGPHVGAAIVEATRLALAFSVLRQLEPSPAPRKRRPARQSTEH